MRIRWAGVAKGAAIAVAALIALQALPDLLRPPQPPPLDPDVGLPRVLGNEAHPEPARPARSKLRFQTHRMRAKGTTGSAARDAIGSKPRRARPAPIPVAAPEPVPDEPPAAAAPAPTQTPPPSPPAGDGSEEFAPR